MIGNRVLRHLATPAWRVRQAFPASAMQAIETAIHASEKAHSGQICFAVEAALDPLPLLRGITARTRAVEIFSQLRVWDTAHNNGVLIYLLLADRDVEILADRGIHAQVGSEGWERICRDMEAHFRAGRFEEGTVSGIRAVGELLTRHYPGQGSNELPDRPVVL